MRIRRTTVTVGVVAVLLISLAGGLPAYGQRDSLELLVWDTEEYGIRDLFELIQSYVVESMESIQVASVPFEQYPAELARRMASGNPPDLFWVTGDMLQQLAESGAISPLGDAIARRPGLLVSRLHRFEGDSFGVQVGPSGAFAEIAYVVAAERADVIERAMELVEYLQNRWADLGTVPVTQSNPPLNTAIAAHGNEDWHIDTANEFLFGTDMNGATTATNHCPNTWTRRHIHVGLTNTNVFYYDVDRITSGDDTDTTSGIDTAMLFFYAGHGFPPSSWDTLGNSASVSNVSIGDEPGWGMLRYYWQCSCTVFAHGPDCCAGDTCSSWHPCPSGGEDWWYQCPDEFAGGSDSISTPNVYERWGAAINPNLRMACGSSTCAYCHQYQMNSIWNNYNNLGYDVADSFIDGLTTGSVVPLCISMGGANVNTNPLVADTAFTNQPNTSGTDYYYIQYRSGFGSSSIGGTVQARIPDTLPKVVVVRPMPIPDPWLLEEYRIEDEWKVTWDEIDDRGPRVRINQRSGAMFVVSPAAPIGVRTSLSEEDYIDRAWGYIDELGWEEGFVSDPVGSRMMIAAVPVEGANEQQTVQKNVIVTFRRLLDVNGSVVPVLGEGGVMEVQMNNDGTLLNASKVWRQIAGFDQYERVRTFEEAADEALQATGHAWAYDIDDWAWGYVEAAGNEAQEIMELVYWFWLTPTEQGQLRDLAPVIIEVPA